MSKVKGFFQKVIMKCITILKIETIDYQVSIRDEKDDDIKIKFEKDILRLLKKYKIGGDLKGIQNIKIKCDVEEYPLVTIKELII